MKKGAFFGLGYTKRMTADRGMFMLRVLLIIVSLLMATQSQARDDAGLILAVPKEGYPPYIIVSNEETSGILVDVLRQAIKPLGLTVQLRYLEEIRSMNLLDRKIIDARMESPKWVDHPERYLWSEPIVAINDRFVFNKQAKNVFEDDALMAGAVLSVHLGYGYPTLQEHFDNLYMKRADYATEHAMLSSLLKKGAKYPKAAVMDVNVAKWLMREHKEFRQQFIFSKRLVDSTPIHFQFAKNKKMARWVSEINQQIQTMAEEGTLDRIVRNTLSNENQ